MIKFLLPHAKNFSNNLYMSEIFDKPIPGIEIAPPKELPLPGYVIIGYKLDKSNEYNEYFAKPIPQKMNIRGIVASIGCLICFFPLVCVPCFLSCSYNKVQRPVYGPPKHTERLLSIFQNHPDSYELVDMNKTDI